MTIELSFPEEGDSMYMIVTRTFESTVPEEKGKFTSVNHGVYIHTNWCVEIREDSILITQ